ncbi:hypothetical protein HDU76_007917, partial [Blyttiomyces sp. JEL0837]
DNALNGSLPDGFGFSSTLTSVKLGGNQLIGSVPSNFKGSSLNTFDIGENCLTGPLPTSIPRRFSLGAQGTSCPGYTANHGADSTTNGTSNARPSDSTTENSSHIGAIVGGAVTCLVVVAVVAIFSVLWMRRRKKQKEIPLPKTKETIIPVPVAAVPVASWFPWLGEKFTVSNNPSTGGWQDQQQPPFLSRAQHVPPALELQPQGRSSAPRVWGVHSETFHGNAKGSPLFDPISDASVTRTVEFALQSRPHNFQNMDLARLPPSIVDSGNTPLRRYGPSYEWSSEQVMAWVYEHRLGEEVESAILIHNVDGLVLHSLTLETLKSELNISDLRTRIRFINAIESLRP